jgi:pimeloyl-ACP methyl ester carboxylesterase
MRFSHPLLATAALVSLAACSDSELPSTAPTGRASFNTTSVTVPESGPWARIVEGKIGPGSIYALYIPTTWNGDAVFYSHGIRDVDSPVDLRDQDHFGEISDILGANGFAIAYSSWPENGVVVKAGEQAVHETRGLLAAELSGQPKRSFLMGHSLGSGVALDLVQTLPDQYNGAFLVCGMVGGTLLESQYAGNVRALFDTFYPGALPGDVLRLPFPVSENELKQIIGQVLQANPAPLFVIASLSQTPLPYVPIGNPFDPSSTAFQTLAGSLYGPLSYQTRFANNLFDLAHGHSTFDNSATTYSVGSNPLLPPNLLDPVVAFANANVKRYTFDPAGLNFMENYFQPTGVLRIPVLTLHNSWDPGIPAFHERVLYNKVETAGFTQNLLQRFYPGFGHCEIPGVFQAQNFLDMVNWVTTGTKPAS